jgi:hypothetical protein
MKELRSLEVISEDFQKCFPDLISAVMLVNDVLSNRLSAAESNDLRRKFLYIIEKKIRSAPIHRENSIYYTQYLNIILLVRLYPQNYYEKLKEMSSDMDTLIDFSDKGAKECILSSLLAEISIAMNELNKKK